MTADPELTALSLAAARAGEDHGELVRLVADGIVWHGRLVGPAIWAAARATTPAEGDIARDRGAEDTAEDARSYLHFAVASFLAGTEWHRARGVRIAIDRVSAWWQPPAED